MQCLYFCIDSAWSSLYNFRYSFLTFYGLSMRALAPSRFALGQVKINLLELDLLKAMNPGQLELVHCQNNFIYFNLFAAFLYWLFLFNKFQSNNYHFYSNDEMNYDKKKFIRTFGTNKFRWNFYKIQINIWAWKEVFCEGESHGKSGKKISIQEFS